MFSGNHAVYHGSILLALPALHDIDVVRFLESDVFVTSDGHTLSIGFDLQHEVST